MRAESIVVQKRIKYRKQFKFFLSLTLSPFRSLSLLLPEEDNKKKNRQRITMTYQYVGSRKREEQKWNVFLRGTECGRREETIQFSCLFSSLFLFLTRFLPFRIFSILPVLSSLPIQFLSHFPCPPGFIVLHPIFLSLSSHVLSLFKPS